MKYFIGFLLLMSLPLLLNAETFDENIPVGTEPPAPTWAVYIPTENPGTRAGETAVAANADNAGVLDASKKCTWYSQTDGSIKGAWFTHIVFFNGNHITNNNDPAIWSGTNAVLSLKLLHQDPREYVLQLNGNDLTDADGYTVVRMIYVKPGLNNMPSTPYLVGSQISEEFRQFNENKFGFTIPSAGYWISAEEVSYGLWEEITADPGLDATISTKLTADGLIANKTRFVGMKQPITYMTYDDAAAFCSVTLSGKIGATARLPNEAEWEYAARSGKESAYANAKGYTLDGFSTAVFGSYADYYAKAEVKVNGSTNIPAPNPVVLSTANVLIDAKVAEDPNDDVWAIKPSSVRYTIESEIIAVAPVVSKTYLDANYNSYYKKWFSRVYAFKANAAVDGSTGFFSIDPNNGNTFLMDDRNSWDKTEEAGMYATSDPLLAKVVKGLYVPVGYDSSNALNPWYYTHDNALIVDYLKVVDGIMPIVNNQTPVLSIPPSEIIYYYKLHEYNHKGMNNSGPFLHSDFLAVGAFVVADQDLIDAPLDWENGYPAWVTAQLRKSITVDALEFLHKNIDYHRANVPSLSHISLDTSKFEYTYTINHNGMITKKDRYEYRNDWGLSNVHGNVAEWCIPGGQSGNINKRWDGMATYEFDVASPSNGYTTSLGASAKKFVAARGGSWNSSMEDCRCSYRMPVKPDASEPTIGFRFIIP